MCSLPCEEEAENRGEKTHPARSLRNVRQVNAKTKFKRRHAHAGPRIDACGALDYGGRAWRDERQVKGRPQILDMHMDHVFSICISISATGRCGLLSGFNVLVQRRRRNHPHSRRTYRRRTFRIQGVIEIVNPCSNLPFPHVKTSISSITTKSESLPRN